MTLNLLESSHKILSVDAESANVNDCISPAPRSLIMHLLGILSIFYFYPGFWLLPPQIDVSLQRCRTLTNARFASSIKSIIHQSLLHFFQINHKRQLYVCQQNNHTIGHHWIEQWPKKSFAKVRSSLLTGTDRCVYAVADRQQTFSPVHSSFHQITFSQTFTWFWIKTFHANLTCMNFQGIDLFCEWEGCDKW